VQRTRDGHTGRVLGGRTIGRLGDAVFGVHCARGDEECEYLGRASKPRSTVCQWFGLKMTGTVFFGLGPKPVVLVFTGLASKPVATVFSGLTSKPVVTVFCGLSSKSVVTVFSGLTSKSVATVFSGLASKPVATVSRNLTSKPVVGFLVEPQNQGGGGFPSLGHKTGSYGLVIWVSKSPRRFVGSSFKTKQATIYQLRHKIDRTVIAWDTH
jgi:hypothetical protein